MKKYISNQLIKKTKILFVCNSNSCRSIIAEHLTNKMYNSIVAQSAGIKPKPINPYVVQVMRENEIDLSSGSSQNINHVAIKTFDLVITLCDHNELDCPLAFESINMYHKPIDGPSKYARMKESEEDKLSCYRKVRDEILDFVNELPNICQISKLQIR